MRGRTLALTLGAAMVALMAQSGANAGQWPETKPYVAGSTGITVNVAGMASVNEAGGAVDCATGVGGACFDTTGHEGELFTVSAVDDNSGSVGIFAGFDVDGDGCVACKNGSALGNDGDVFFQDADSVTGIVPQGLKDPILYVFVRVTTLNTGDVGSTGTLTIDRGCGSDPTGECKIDQDPQMGTVCGPRGGTPQGDGCTHVMYPYPGNP